MYKARHTPVSPPLEGSCLVAFQELLSKGQTTVALSYHWRYVHSQDTQILLHVMFN